MLPIAAQVLPATALPPLCVTSGRVALAVLVPAERVNQSINARARCCAGNSVISPLHERSAGAVAQCGCGDGSRTRSIHSLRLAKLWTLHWNRRDETIPRSIPITRHHWRLLRARR